MKDEIKYWLEGLDELSYEKILDYITNLQEDTEMYAQLKDEYEEEIKDLQQKIEQYENPDDMTLFYMWLDIKAKDKMKELEQENERLKRILDEMGVNPNQVLDYKSRCEKASDNLKRNYWIKEHEHNDDVVNMTLNILRGNDE